LEAKLAAGDASSEVLDEYSSISTKLEEEMGSWEQAQQNLENLLNQ